jgi:hypothetical protein
MIKKLMLLAMMAMVVSGFAASMAHATAGKTWTDKNKVTNVVTHLAAGTNPVIHAAGKAKFSNVTLGGTECPVTAEIQLTGATPTAHVLEFVITNTAECVLNGPLATSCTKITGDEVTGTTGKPLKTANGGAWLATGTVSAAVPPVASLDILSEIQIHNTYEPKAGEAGLLCPKKVTLESTATAKPTITFDSASAANSVTLGGTLTATNTESGAHLGNVNITGNLEITPEASRGTYGIT